MTIKDELRIAVRKWMIGSVELKQLLEDDDPKFDEAYENGEISHEMFDEIVNEVRTMFAEDQNSRDTLDKLEHLDDGDQLEMVFHPEDYEAGL